MAMKIKLRPDGDVHVQKLRIGRLPVLVLRQARRAAIPV